MEEIDSTSQNEPNLWPLAFASISDLVRGDGLSSRKARLGFPAILRADLDHGLVRCPGDREDIEQDPVLLVLGIGLEADGVERQDLSALQERAPTGDQCGLCDVELLERVRIRSAADESRQLGQLAQGSDVAMIASISCSADFRMDIAVGRALPDSVNLIRARGTRDCGPASERTQGLPPRLDRRASRRDVHDMHS
jgi:hypothetical protein